MDITAFIRELLFGHDCVIIPGFGGFIGNYTPARLDKSEGMFYPPVKQISFNRNLNHNDGLLIGRISGTAGINYGDARDIVDRFVADVRRKLDKGEKVVFDRIGSFENNKEGNIQFEPDRTANYHLDSYGLEAFQCLPLEGYDLRKRVIRLPEQEGSRKFPLRKILWRAAIIVPLLSLLVAVPLKTDLFRGKIEATTMNPLVLAEFEDNKAALDNNKPAQETAPEEANQAATPVSTEAAPVPEKIVVSADIPEATAPAAVEARGTYYLITGSFQTEKNALHQVRILQEEGFNPEVVAASNGFYRVCAMVCPDIETARSRKDSISAKFPGTWISRKK